MQNKIINLAFWLSDLWAGMLCVFCICGALAFPFVMPVYEHMNKVEAQGTAIHFLVSGALLFVACAAHKVMQRSLLGLLCLFIAITAFSVTYKGAFLWISIMPIILLPYILTGPSIIKISGRL
jgi:hypothetical protein